MWGQISFCVTFLFLKVGVVAVCCFLNKPILTTTYKCNFKVPKLKRSRYVLQCRKTSRIIFFFQPQKKPKHSAYCNFPKWPGEMFSNWSHCFRRKLTLQFSCTRNPASSGSIVFLLRLEMRKFEAIMHF